MDHGYDIKFLLDEHNWNHLLDPREVFSNNISDIMRKRFEESGNKEKCDKLFLKETGDEGIILYDNDFIFQKTTDRLLRFMMDLSSSIDNEEDKFFFFFRIFFSIFLLKK